MDKFIRQGKLKKLESIYKQFMIELGLDLDDPNAKETPFRVAKMYLDEFTRGLRKIDFELKTFPNNNYDQYIVVKNIKYYSLCAHHHIPFFGTVGIVYFPDKRLLGLSKFARVVKYFAAKPQIQEQMTQEIANFLYKKLKPKGIYVLVKGRHLCMEARGVKSEGAETVTSVLLGDIDKEEALRLLKE